MKYLIVFLAVAGVTFYYAKNEKYSMEEITTNFSVLGMPVDNFDLNSWDYGLKLCFRDFSVLGVAHMLRNGNSGSLDVVNGYSKIGRSTIEIYDVIKNYRYRLPYNDGKLIGLSVQPNTTFRNDGTSNLLSKAQETINTIVNDYGYFYVKSNNQDKIIKTEGKFCIVGLISKDNFDSVTGINFFVYNRSKYFK